MFSRGMDNYKDNYFVILILVFEISPKNKRIPKTPILEFWISTYPISRNLFFLYIMNFIVF